MPTYSVTVMRSIETQVEVVADDAKAAIDMVDSRSFELPPRDEWTGHKDWYMRAQGDDPEDYYEQER